jgi:hypothetical protein
MWCLTARIDPAASSVLGLGWFHLDLLDKFSHTTYDIYRDALFFVITAMNGGADGWIYGTTNIEFFSGSLVFLLGASLFIGFISQVATEWTLRNI